MMRVWNFNCLVTAIALAVSAMPVTATCADEPGDANEASSTNSYFRPLVSNTAFRNSTSQMRPAMLSEPGRLRVTPASFETTAVPMGSSADSNDLSFLDDQDEPVTQSETTDLTMLWQLVAVMGVTVLVCCVVFVKKSFRQQASGDAGQMELIATLPLSHRAVVQLVSAKGNTVLVASDAAGVKSVVLLPPTFSEMIEPSVSTEAQHG